MKNIMFSCLMILCLMASASIQEPIFSLDQHEKDSPPQEVAQESSVLFVVSYEGLTVYHQGPEMGWSWHQSDLHLVSSPDPGSIKHLNIDHLCSSHPNSPTKQEARNRDPLASLELKQDCTKAPPLQSWPGVLFPSNDHSKHWKHLTSMEHHTDLPTPLLS